MAVCRLRSDGAVLLGGPAGWPLVRREQVDGHRTLPKEGGEEVGALHPKDLPALIEGPRDEEPLLVSPRSGPFSRQDVSRHEFEEIDRSARRRRADVAAEDHGSDGRGCGDGAWEANESGLPSVWRSQRGASVVPITRTPRPFSPPPSRPPLSLSPPRTKDATGAGAGAVRGKQARAASPLFGTLSSGAAAVPTTRTPRPFSPPLSRPALSPTPTTPTPTAPRPPLSDMARRHNTRSNTRQKASPPPIPAHHAARLMRVRSAHAHARRPQTSRAAARPLLLLPQAPSRVRGARLNPTGGASMPSRSRSTAAVHATSRPIPRATHHRTTHVPRACVLADVRAQVSSTQQPQEARLERPSSPPGPPRPSRPTARSSKEGAAEGRRGTPAPPHHPRAHDVRRACAPHSRRTPASSDRARPLGTGPPRPSRPIARAPWDRTWRDGGRGGAPSLHLHPLS